MLAARGELSRALQILYRALAANPNDLTLRFNYGYALWRNGNFQEAVPNLKVIVGVNPRDGIAQYLLAKSLAGAGQSAEATKADQEARRFLSDYAKWEVAPANIPPLARVKFEFNRASFYRLERQHQNGPDLPRAQTVPPPQGLERARQLFEAKNDAEALHELERVLVADATVADAHLLRGKIYQRRNEIEQAISALTAAVYWNPRLVAAHVALGQLYLGRGDRARALAHGKQALEIDPADRDALALKRQIETGR
jgi:tetratricopeptide (TPR) repeat protein